MSGLPVASCFAANTVETGQWFSPDGEQIDQVDDFGLFVRYSISDTLPVNSGYVQSGFYQVTTKTVVSGSSPIVTTKSYNSFVPDTDLNSVSPSYNCVYASGESFTSAGVTTTITGSAGRGTYLNVESSASSGSDLYYTDILISVTARNTTDQAASVNHINMTYSIPGFSSGLVTDTTDNLICMVFGNQNLYFNSQNYNFVVPAHSDSVYSFSLRVFTSSSDCNFSSFKMWVDGLAYGDFASTNPATDGGIRDTVEDQYDTDSGQQEEITGDVNTAVTDIENIGLFSFLIDFSKQFVGVFSSGDDSTALTLPGFSITVDGQQLTVWEAQTFDFATMEGPFAVLLAAMRLGTSVVVIGALISYLFGLYEHIFAGSEQY